MSLLLIISPALPFSWLYYQDLGLLGGCPGQDCLKALHFSCVGTNETGSGRDGWGPCKETWNEGNRKETMANSLPPWGLSLLPPWNRAAAYVFYVADCCTSGRVSSRPLPTPLGNSSPVSASRQFTVTFRDPSSDPCQHPHYLNSWGHTGVLQGQILKIKDTWDVSAQCNLH